MASILFKWSMAILLQLAQPAAGKHPVYVSVAEIEYNAKEKALEISCKIFTDDFEQALRGAYKTHVDLLDGRQKAAMDKLVEDYVKEHFQVAVEGKNLALRYLGYEQIEEGIYCYFSADNLNAVKNISITDNILYEYKEQQMGLIHCTVNGNTKNYKLTNPEDKVTFRF